MTKKLQPESNPVFIIARTLPKYSESWMQRINKYLQPNAVFIAIHSNNDGVEGSIDDIPYLTIVESKGPVQRIFNEVYKRNKIRERIENIINTKRVSNDPVLILCHFLTNADLLYPLWLKQDLIGIVHCHGQDVTWKRKVESLPFLPAHKLGYEKRVASRLVGSVEVIANSKSTEEKLKKIGFQPQSIYRKYFGVDTNQIPIKKYSPKEKLKVLYLGRLTDFKGPIETILAFSIARNRGFLGELTIAGGGALHKKCKNLIRKLNLENEIKLLGPVDRAAADELLTNSDVFTAHNKISSKTGQEEGFGVSIIEAMARGIPIVTGASGGVLDSVVNNVNGILFKPGDVNAHANAILSLQRNPRDLTRMGIAGRKRVEELFSLEVEQKTLHGILQDCIEKHRYKSIAKALIE